MSRSIATPTVLEHAGPAGRLKPGRAVWSWLCWLWWCAASFTSASGGAPPPGPPPLITSAQQVLALGAEGAKDFSHPVRLRAVVTYPVLRRCWFYVADETAGVLVVCTNEVPAPKPGDLVEINGQAGPGLQAPHVYCGSYRVVGRAPFPAPRVAEPARLAEGEGFGQWLSVQGNVLDYFIYPEPARPDQISLLLQEGDQHFVVNVTLDGPIDPPDSWLGGRVEVHGVCWNEAREGGVITGFRMHSPSTNELTFLRLGSTNLFAWPRVSARELAARRDWHNERVRVSGVTTLSTLNQTLFLKDETGDVQARLLKPIIDRPFINSVNADTLFQTIPPGRGPTAYARPRPYLEPLDPGDVVEVIGTPVVSAMGVFLADAEYRKVGRGTPPAAVNAAAADLFAGRCENKLVRFQGRLLDRQTHASSYRVDDALTLRWRGKVVQVAFASEPSRALPILPQGAFLEVVGVCSTEVGDWQAVRTVRLFPRDREDIRMLAPPAPWDSWEVSRLLLTSAALGLGALLWIVLLRLRVANRTAQLALSNARLRAEVEERKRAQGELGRALSTEKELNQLKSRFVSLVSHEFRTPLGVILASADLLSDYLDTLSPEERAEQIADIKQATRHMAGLMEDVLVLGRVESGRMGYRPRDFDLEEFCQRIVEDMLVATSSRCPILFESRGIIGPARGDETLLRHVLNNLLSNGVKYSAPGQPVCFRAERHGEEAVLTVSDQGIGIAEADQKHVFEAFYRGKNVGERPGSGLGLVVVKRCVEIHGGQLQLESAEARGTTIRVLVPLFRGAGHTDLFVRSPNGPSSPLL